MAKGAWAADSWWSHEEYLAAVLETEVNARNHSGAALRVKAAGFPAVKTLDEFTLNHRPGISKDHLAKLASRKYLTEADNVIFLGLPGTGKTHLQIALTVLACYRGDRVLFDTASGWVSRLQHAHQSGILDKEPARLGRYGLIIIDEVGYFPFEPDAANLFVQIVSNRYEHASVISTSNLPFGRWGEMFGDQTIAPAMIDRLVHHAEVHSLTGNSYRTGERNLDTLPSKEPENKTQEENKRGLLLKERNWPRFRRALTLTGLIQELHIASPLHLGLPACACRTDNRHGFFLFQPTGVAVDDKCHDWRSSSAHRGETLERHSHSQRSCEPHIQPRGRE